MRIWFITGAARGLGARITEAALKNGDAVVATGRDTKAIEATFGGHPNLLALRLDVTSEDEAREAVAAALKRFGRIDVLVNNAGYGLLGAIEEATREEVERVFATNVFGLLTVTRAVLPQMRRQRSGHVINISSLGGYASYPGWGIYGATKFAVEGITEALAAEVAPLGIQTTVVEPGFFRTDFLDGTSLKSAQAIEDYGPTVGATRAGAEARNHAQPGDPVKFAQALLKLVAAEKPPLRLPLGSDALQRITDKHTQVEQEIAAWRELALSTDSDPAST